jgi:hypothetical protein
MQHTVVAKWLLVISKAIFFTPPLQIPLRFENSATPLNITNNQHQHSNIIIKFRLYSKRNFATLTNLERKAT